MKIRNLTIFNMMNFTGEHILSTKQFSREEIERIIEVAKEMEGRVTEGVPVDFCKGQVLTSLFYEPSTRTRLSFETAMYKLGGGVVTVVGEGNSSLAKGETLVDTGKVVNQIADVIVMRHREKGSVEEFAGDIATPVINAGDGPGEHPTQALLDMFTIEKERGKIDGLTIVMAGDLKYGRTVHSLSQLLSNYKVKLKFVSPEELKMPDEITTHLKEKGVEYEETVDLAEAIKEADVLYQTRIQEERFENRDEYLRLKGSYVIDRKFIGDNNNKITVMHPLPRIDEISPDLDDYDGSAYFRQVQNGVFVRMALITLVLGLR